MRLGLYFFLHKYVSFWQLLTKLEICIEILRIFTEKHQKLWNKNANSSYFFAKKAWNFRWNSISVENFRENSFKTIKFKRNECFSAGNTQNIKIHTQWNSHMYMWNKRKYAYSCSLWLLMSNGICTKISIQFGIGRRWLSTLHINKAQSLSLSFWAALKRKKKSIRLKKVNAKKLCKTKKGRLLLFFYVAFI